MSPERIETELFGHAKGAFAGAHQEPRRLVRTTRRAARCSSTRWPSCRCRVQAALLRVLDDRRIRPVGSEQQIAVDVRIVAATNRPLADEVAAGRFRKDLYYRLQVVEIALPPLRAHKDDIPDLVAHFIATLAPQLGVDADRA